MSCDTWMSLSQMWISVAARLLGEGCRSGIIRSFPNSLVFPALRRCQAPHCATLSTSVSSTEGVDAVPRGFPRSRSGFAFVRIRFARVTSPRVLSRQARSKSSSIVGRCVIANHRNLSLREESGRDIVSSVFGKSPSGSHCTQSLSTPSSTRSPQPPAPATSTNRLSGRIR